MADRELPDTAVRLEWLAWQALQGNEPLKYVAEYLDSSVSLLGEYNAKMQGDRTAEDDAFLAGLRLVLIGLSSALRGDGSTAYKIDFKRAKRGKPINIRDRALIGHRAASLVEEAVRKGIKQEAAIAQATEETQLSRAEIFSWLKHRQNLANPDWIKGSLETMQMPKHVQLLLQPYKSREESGQNDE